MCYYTNIEGWRSQFLPCWPLGNCEFPENQKKACAKIVQFKGARNLKGELIYVFDGCAKIWGAKIWGSENIRGAKI